MKTPVLLSLTLISAAIAPAFAQETSSARITAGRDVALKICANCHVVAREQAEPILKPAAPGFAEIARRPDMTEAALKNFLAKPHGEARRTSRMPGFMLSEQQIDDVVAYLVSLK